jgi:AraC-like DNA-binding protein
MSSTVRVSVRPMAESKQCRTTLSCAKVRHVDVEIVQSDAGRMFIELVEDVPQLMAALKEKDGRYAYVNAGFAQRLGRSPAAIVGATVHEVFAADLADSYATQDDSVLSTRRPLTSHLELIVRADRTLGWYVTSKATVMADGEVIGLSVLSIDLQSQLHSAHAGLARAISSIRRDIHRSWRVAELAGIAALSPVQLERQTRRTLGLSPRRLLQRLRLEHAVLLITSTDQSLGDIAAACGFYDQSSFTRQFRSVLGRTPGAYRRSA